MAYPISAKVWLYSGKAGWHFVTIDKQDADEIKKFDSCPRRRGFGSIPVSVIIGKTTWKISIFPDKYGSYLLPIKKAVRFQESIKAGDTITISLKVII